MSIRNGSLSTILETTVTKGTLPNINPERTKLNKRESNIQVGSSAPRSCSITSRALEEIGKSGFKAPERLIFKN